MLVDPFLQIVAIMCCPSRTMRYPTTYDCVARLRSFRCQQVE